MAKVKEHIQSSKRKKTHHMQGNPDKAADFLAETQQAFQVLKEKYSQPRDNCQPRALEMKGRERLSQANKSWGNLSS